MYRVKVLSGCDRSKYGCEYDSDVGLLYPGEAAENDTRGELARSGEDARGNEAGSLVLSVADVVSRELRRVPSGDNHISCTPTDQPEVKVGIAYAIVAMILLDEERIARESGGHVVCDRNEWSSRGEVREDMSSSNLYSDSSCAAVMVTKYGEHIATADSMPFEDGGCWNCNSSSLLRLSNSYSAKLPSSKPIATL
jgi:hypothetical protein